MRRVVFLIVLLLAGRALAGTEITIETRRAGAAPEARPQTSVVEIEGRRLRAEAGDGRHAALWSAEAGVLQILDHRERSILRIDRTTASQMAGVRDGLEQQIERLPEAQRAALERWIGSGAKPRVEMRATGGSTKVNGISCRLLEALSAGARVAEICEGPQGALGIGAETLRPARELAAFVAEFGDLLPASLGGENLEVLVLVDRVAGVPLRVRAWPKNAAATESRILRALPRPIAAERFEPPADYQPRLGVHVGAREGDAPSP
jgi:hypothetical protein